MSISNISMIIPSFNRSRNLYFALESIGQQLRDHFIEIIVIDDGSTDDTREVVQQFMSDYPHLDVKYIYNEKIVGQFRCPSVGWNLGLVYAKHDIIIQSGADIIVPKGGFQALISEFINKKCMVSARLYRLSEDVLPGLEKDIVLQFADERKYPALVEYTGGNKANATPFLSIYHKQWAYNIGLYDENFSFGGGEDCDFVIRMQKETDTMWADNAICIHQNHPKFGGNERNSNDYEKNRERFKRTKEGLSNRWQKKILFLGSFNYYKIPGLLQDSLKQQFMRLGHNCYFFDPCIECHSDVEINTISYNPFWEEQETELQRIIDEFQPDIVFSTFKPAYDLIQKIDRRDALHVGWFGDMRDPEFLSQYQNLFDLFFVTNIGQVNEYAKILNCTVAPAHFAVSNTGHVKLDVPKEFEVGFAGLYPSKQLHLKRNDLLDSISKNFKFRHINRELWSTNELYNKCKIIICDNCDKSNVEKISGYSSNRFFNAVGSGSFTLVRYFPGLEKFGTNKEHFVWFKSNKECLKLIRYYLDNEEERERIASNGYEKFHTDQTWEKLAVYLNDTIKKALNEDS